MSHFYEKLNSEINLEYELDKLKMLVEKENLGYNYPYPLIEYIDYNVFRTTSLSTNYLSFYDLLEDVMKKAPSKSEKFINYCEIFLSIIYQYGEDNNPKYTEKTSQVLQIINFDLRKLNLIQKNIINDEYGPLVIIIPNDTVLESALESVDDSNVQEYLIEYKSSHNNGNIKRKKELLKLISNYIEGITKSKTYRECNKRLFDDVDFLYNNLDLRHNPKIKDSGFFEKASLELEKWLDITYEESLLVIKSKSEYDNHINIEKLKKS